MATGFMVVAAHYEGSQNIIFFHDESKADAYIAEYNNRKEEVEIDD